MTISREAGKLPSTQTNAVGLAAIGVSGSWEVALNQPVSNSNGWILQIEGPFVSLSFPITSLAVLEEMSRFLKTFASDELSLHAGKLSEISLLRDHEFADRFFLMIQSKDGITFRLTIIKPELDHLSDALSQVRSDLEE